MSSSSESQGLGRTAWLVIIVAAIGFLFDTYELLMTPLILAPALSELMGLPLNHPRVTSWIGNVLWLSALSGGIFGLMGGWLIDRFGRKTVMIGSIFIYSLSPVAAGLSTSLEALVFFRCATFVGVCVEFVAAITWLSELFADKRQRELAIGWTQAFASVGGLFVTSVSHGIRTLVANQALPMLPVGDPTNPVWRYTLMTGLIPAIPIALLLPFVPESEVWLERKRSGTLKRPKFTEIFAPGLLRTTWTSTLLMACAYAAAFGTLQVTVAQGVAGLPDLAPARAKIGPLRKANVALQADMKNLSTDSADYAAKQEAYNENLKKIRAVEKDEIGPRKEQVQFLQELGGLAGRVLLAIGLVLIASKRLLLWLFQVPGMIVIPLVWFWVYPNASEYFAYGAFLAGACIVAQFSYFGEYLPKAFPVHLRGTGGAFASNVGGRMIGTSAAFLTTRLVAPMLAGGFDARPDFATVAKAAGVTGLVVFAIGFIVSFFLPEAEGKEEKV